MVTFSIRLTVEQVAQIDEERRIPTSTGVPSRCAVVRSLLDDGLAFRRSMRPKSSGPGRGEPFYIDLSDLR